MKNIIIHIFLFSMFFIISMPLLYAQNLDPRGIPSEEIQKYLIPKNIISLKEAMRIARDNKITRIVNAGLTYDPMGGFFYVVRGFSENDPSDIYLTIDAKTGNIAQPLTQITSQHCKINLAEAILLGEKLGAGKVLDARVDTWFADLRGTNTIPVYVVTVLQSSPFVLKVIRISAIDGSIVQFSYEDTLCARVKQSAAEALEMVSSKHYRTPVSIDLIDKNGVTTYKISFENELFLPNNIIMIDAGKREFYNTADSFLDVAEEPLR
ncbi:MAG: PepSY domain-containing protein [Candidatus Omnitrophica bacterium]|nr:PepSY domain-containing protein [Candidatus Omnitrophota bacterium]MBU1924479.1 PepSY domain-containing protein [Candidatus Omnitrophota bacterium]